MSSTVLKESALSLIRQWGGNATDALLDPRCKYFYLTNYQGLIGFREFDGCRVVYGDPVCSPQDIPELIEKFHQECMKDQKSYIFLPATQDFALWYFENYGGATLEFGELLSLDPHNDPRKKQGIQASLVRRKSRHAAKENVTIHEYIPTDSELESKIEKATDAWTQNRKGPQVHISDHRLFEDRPGKRWFYATVSDNVVGSLVLNRLEKDNGWLLNHLTYIPTAPHGTQELLVISTLDQLAKEDCHYVSFGATPALEIRDIAGLGRYFAILVQSGYKFARKLLHIEGHKKFWEKFDPSCEPAYIVFSRNHIGWTEVHGIINAMNVTLL